jgi:hypothetical protein
MASSKVFLGKVQGLPLALEEALAVFPAFLGFFAVFFVGFLLLTAFGAVTVSSLITPPVPA